jgi:hypothetical protein
MRVQAKVMIPRDRNSLREPSPSHLKCKGKRPAMVEVIIEGNFLGIVANIDPMDIAPKPPSGRKTKSDTGMDTARESLVRMTPLAAVRHGLEVFIVPLDKVDPMDDVEDWKNAHPDKWGNDTVNRREY